MQLWDSWIWKHLRNLISGKRAIVLRVLPSWKERWCRPWGRLQHIWGSHLFFCIPSKGDSLKNPEGIPVWGIKIALKTALKGNQQEGEYAHCGQRQHDGNAAFYSMLSAKHGLVRYGSFPFIPSYEKPIKRPWTETNEKGPPYTI